MRSNSHPVFARLLLGLALALSPAVVACPALAAEPTAQDREEAKRAYAEARKLTKEGKLPEALEKFRRAHDLAPTPVTRLDLARALQGQGKLVEAHALALATPDMPVTATETQKSKVARAEARELASALAARLPKVVLAVKAPEGETEVAIDGLPVGKELLGAEQPVDPGEHVATLQQAGRKVERPFSIAEAERKTIDLELAPLPPEPAPAVVAPPAAPKPNPKPRPVPSTAPPEEDGIHPFVPVMFTIGGVGLLTGVITGSIAASQAADLKDACPNDRCPPAWHDELATHQALTLTSTITFVLGGAAVAAGGVGWIIDATASSGSPNNPSPSVTARWTGTGFALDGTW